MTERESFIVSVSGRPVGLLSPVGKRPATMPGATMRSLLEVAAADPELRRELADALPDSADDAV